MEILSLIMKIYHSFLLVVIDVTLESNDINNLMTYLKCVHFKVGNQVFII